MRRPIILLLVLVLVVGVAVAIVVVQLQQNKGTTVNGTPVSGTPGPTTPTATISVAGIPHAQGSQLVDAAGHPFLLRGAQIESPFNYIKRWEKGQSPFAELNPTVFNAMVHDWHMNALRLPISNWLWAKYTSDYMSKLDQVVQEANAAGLFVVFDLHDTVQSGSPYGTAATLPKTEDIPFWKAIASHYKDNPMVMFDVFNEPKYQNWDQWLHGGGTVNGATVVGTQDLVDAIRSVGARQVIVVEPGSAGKGVVGVDAAEESGWTTIGNHIINDPNIMYSLHVYDHVVDPPQVQDVKWGPILHHYPIYYGEWAFLPNANIPAHCKSIPHDQAPQIVQNFLNYMASRGANWTAWQFDPGHLVQNYTTFAPTTLNVPWTCGDTTSGAGMGEVIKQYLTGQA